MTFPVLIEPVGDQFAASLAGSAQLRVVAPTRADAIAAIEDVIEKRVQRGELFELDVPTTGLADLWGSFADDPTLREICAEAYRLRDADRPI